MCHLHLATVAIPSVAGFCLQVELDGPGVAVTDRAEQGALGKVAHRLLRLVVGDAAFLVSADVRPYGVGLTPQDPSSNRYQTP